ncbi:MAG: IMP cyclohydrolase [Acidimicrobiia bacterium]
MCPERAQSFQEFFERNAYPGRGLAIGLDDAGRANALYWVTGRSTASRQRRAQINGTDVVIGAASEDGAHLDPLRHYRALWTTTSGVILGNGSHVTDIAEQIAHGTTFAAALAAHGYEPDPPLHTPRIAGMIETQTGSVWVGCARRSGLSHGTEHLVMHARTPAGLALGLTTYKSDGEQVEIDARPQWVRLPTEASPIDVLWQLVDPRFAVLAVSWTNGDIQIRDTTRPVDL